MLARHVMDWVLACLNEAEADGYQQQDGLRVHDDGVEFGLVTDTELWIKVGLREFRLKLSRRRQSAEQGEIEATGGSGEAGKQA